MHFGEPSDYEKECYTWAHSSAINLARLRLPEGPYGRQIDFTATCQLWEADFAKGIWYIMDIMENKPISACKKDLVVYP